MCIYLTNYQLSYAWTTDTRDRSGLRELNPNDTIVLGNVTAKAKGRTLILQQGGRTLRLQEQQLKEIDENDAEIYLNAEMAEEDKKVTYELDMERQFTLTISDISQVLIVRRYIVNNHGERMTVGKKIVALQLSKVRKFLTLIKTYYNDLKIKIFGFNLLCVIQTHAYILPMYVNGLPIVLSPGKWHSPQK